MSPSPWNLNKVCITAGKNLCAFCRKGERKTDKGYGNRHSGDGTPNSPSLYTHEHAEQPKAEEPKPEETKKEEPVKSKPAKPPVDYRTVKSGFVDRQGKMSHFRHVRCRPLYILI